MATRMLQRRGTAAEWAAQNPVPGDGEICFESDTKIIKVGDGVTPYNDLTLPYVPSGGGVMTGNLVIPEPLASNHPVRLTDLETKVSKAGDSMSGPLLVTIPTLPGHAARLADVTAAAEAAQAAAIAARDTIKLGEVELGSVAGTGGLITIPSAVRGTFRSYRLMFYGGLSTVNFQSAITCRINDDSGSNYRAGASAERFDTGAQVDSSILENTGLPRTCFVGSNNGGVTTVDFMPSMLGNTGLIGWVASSFYNGGSTAATILYGRGGGRWNGTVGEFASLRVRSPGNADAFTSQAYAVLYGFK